MDSTALGNVGIKLFSSCHSLQLPRVFCIYCISAAYRKTEQWKIHPEIFQCLSHCFQIQFKLRISILKVLKHLYSLDLGDHTFPHVYTIPFTYQTLCLKLRLPKAVHFWEGAFKFVIYFSFSKGLPESISTYFP